MTRAEPVLLDGERLLYSTPISDTPKLSRRIEHLPVIKFIRPVLGFLPHHGYFGHVALALCGAALC